MKHTILSILAVIVVTCFLPLHATSSDGNNSASNGIILQDANMRTGPGTDFPVTTSLLTGTEILKIQNQGQWAEVKVSRTGKTGWVHSSLVEEASTTSQVFPEIIVGIIDIQRILNESMQGQAAKKRIEQLQSDNEDEYVDLTIEEQITSGIIIEIQAVVESYARGHGYTHIFNKNSGALFYHEMMFDITDDIIAEYDLQMDRKNREP